jgi:hypothetical protein
VTRGWALLVAAASLACGAPAAGVHTSALASRPPPVPVSPLSAPPLEEPAPDPVDPPAADGVKPMVGFLASGTHRPDVQTLRFDIEKLPVATWGEPTPGAGFRLRKIPDGWRLWVRSHIFAEVIVATAPSTGSKVLFTAFTGGAFADGDVPACGTRARGTQMALWSGFSPDGWTRDGVDVEMGTGDLDLETCSASARRSLHGRAAAIVPGYVYALRTLAEDEAGAGRLVVFLPRGAFVSTAGDPTTPIDASNTGSFTRLTFPLAPQAAASAVVRLSPASLALWSSLRATGAPVWGFDDKSAPHDDLLLEVDVSRQDDLALGTISLAVPPGKSRAPYAGLLAAAKK